MSAHHEEEGHHGHEEAKEEWILTNMGGIILPFGKAFEWCVEKTMFLLVNGFVKRVGIVYVVVITPVFLFEFLVNFVRV